RPAARPGDAAGGPHGPPHGRRGGDRGARRRPARRGARGADAGERARPGRRPGAGGDPRRTGRGRAATRRRLAGGRHPAGGREAAMTTILLVDDHALLRKGFRMVLEAEPDLTVVGEAADGVVAVRQVASLAPDVVLMDVRMPGGDGIEATRRIVAAHPGTRVLVLTTFD